MTAAPADLPIPPKPAAFRPDLAPAGIEVKFVLFMADRPPIDTTALHFHTNAAPDEGSVDSAWNVTHAAPNKNTLPHYQVDRTHDGVNRCRKMLPTNLRGIGSTTVIPYTDRWWPLSEADKAAILAHDNVRLHTIVVETADTGTLADPAISAYDDGQLELCARILAYESIVHDFPLAIQSSWWVPGVASHTDPFTFPFTTLYPGKYCPGDRKKVQLRTWILPRAILIRDAWLGITPPPPPPPPPPAPPAVIEGALHMFAVMKYGGTPTLNWQGWFSPNGGLTRYAVRSPGHAALLVALGAVDAKDGFKVTSKAWDDVSHTTSLTELNALLGPAA